jgi:hypothetical protein
LAIRDGGTPALKAARIAFNLPCGKAAGAISVCDFRLLSSGTGSFADPVLEERPKSIVQVLDHRDA